LWVHAPNGLVAGQSAWLGLSLQHQPEWHTYWKNAGDSGLPTQLEWTLPTGLTAGPVLWPLPRKLSVADLTNYGFEGQALLAVPLTVAPSLNPGTSTVEVKLKASWLVCRQECIPQEGQFRLTVPTRSSQAAHAPAFDALLQAQPRALPSKDLKAEISADGLRLRVGGWPAGWQGRPIELFPELNEVIESGAERHPQARQTWQDNVWTAEFPLNAMRSTEPRRFPALLVTSLGSERQGLRVEWTVTGRWPAQTPLPTYAPASTVPNTPTDKPAAVSAPESSPTPPGPFEDRGTDLSWWSALLGAFLGGLILNLMPCVLPVLAIKALHLARADTPARVRRIEGWGYASGVLTSMLALGGSLLVLKAGGQQLGWGFQLQSPLVVSGLALLFTLIALNLWGQFTIERILPASLSGLTSRHLGLDAFLAGVLAVAVATPCTAPFMGASIGLALGLPGWQGLGVFAALGAGLALPLLLIIEWPALAQCLPRPGPWMLSLRQALGFPMLGTVVWLLWVLGQQAGADATSALLGLLVLMAMALWALQRPSRGARVIAMLLLLLWLAAASWTASNLLHTSATPAAQRPDSTWQAWSEAGVREHLQAGRPVFVDYTAAWCITCQVNKRTTLSQASVQAAFVQRRVALMQADWTRQDPAISASLARFGRSGVPVYVLHRPGLDPILLPELLTPGAVLDALSTLQP
jgi:thiol:disulfide interchange protein DsbD